MSPRVKDPFERWYFPVAVALILSMFVLPQGLRPLAFFGVGLLLLLKCGVLAWLYYRDRQLDPKPVPDYVVIWITGGLFLAWLIYAVLRFTRG